MEAALTILQECYGFSYPGGLFLAAVDIMLEKEPVVRAVKQQLQQCAGKWRSIVGIATRTWCVGHTSKSFSMDDC